MKIKSYIFILLIFAVKYSAIAQSVKDSSFRILMVGVHLSGQMAQNDLAARFGANFATGASFTWKTKRNILFGVEGSYVFGKKVKGCVYKFFCLID